MVTQHRLRELFDYDPDTGIFMWRHSGKGRNGSLQAGYVHTNRGGYILIMTEGVCYRAHRLAWLYVYGESPYEIDHINNVRNDNRIANLRETTRSLNNANAKMRVDNKSGFKGVCWDKKKAKWRATIKQRHLGYFDDPARAHAAYKEVAYEEYGEFARPQG